MDLGSMLGLVVVGMVLGAFLTKALFPRIEVREVEIEVKVSKQFTLLQALTIAFSSDPVQRLTLSGVEVDNDTLAHVQKALELAREGYRPSKVGQTFQFFLPSKGSVLTLSAKGVWKDRSGTYMWFDAPPVQQHRRDEQEPPYYP